ncbi:MAG TPA: hypothetical protein VGQ46_15345 [Thermoanaerobaculia bacterium]|jgi:hypothetical protein|nr:hypothetical protein [Thermoanaerobaculia bacterium]
MSADGDSLLARAAAVIANARDVRSETQRVVDQAKLERLRRELTLKMMKIDQLIATSRSRKKKHRLL